MKKTTRLLVLFTLHFLLFSTFNKNAHSFDNLESFGHQEIGILASSLKENCQSKQFFLNIKKNKQYPKFGSIKDWKEFCVKLEDTKSNLKNLIPKNIRIIKNNYPAGLITGYYQPTIKVSFIRNKEYKYPILKKNKIYDLKTRAFIDKNYKDDDIILWTDDYINLFFLQIQGSGIGVFKDGVLIEGIFKDGDFTFDIILLLKLLLKLFILSILYYIYIMFPQIHIPLKFLFFYE